MNNGILASQPFSAGTDLVHIKPLLGVPQPFLTPCHLPKGNDYMVGNSDGSSSEDYVLVVDTSKGTSTTISLTVSAQPNGNFSIDWGDGTSGALIPAGTISVRRPGSYETRFEYTGAGSFVASHTYSKHGIYRVITRGILGSSFTGAAAPVIIPATILISVESFGRGENRIGSINYLGATNLISVPPFLGTSITNLTSVFELCPNVNQKEIVRWDVSKVTNMFRSFGNIPKLLLEGDWKWNARANMFQMFLNTSVDNINFIEWNFGAGMNEMFRVASLNNCSFVNWSGADARFAFRNSVLIDCTFSGWRITSQAAPMFSLGTNNTAFVTNLYMPDWDLRGVTNLANMFNNVVGTKSGLDNWNVSGVTNMSSMFANGSDFMTANLSNWNISKVTNFSFFSVLGPGNTTPNASIRIDNWTIPSGADCFGMFGDAKVNKYVSLSGWKFLGNNNCSSMFGGLNYVGLNFTSNYLNTWDTSGITNMTRMFRTQNNFDGKDISNWNTSNVVSMREMFTSCNSLQNNLGSWNTSNVRDMAGMFNRTTKNGYNGYRGSGLENWDTSSVTGMAEMFDHNYAMNRNFSGWNTGKVTNMTSTFGPGGFGIEPLFVGSGLDNWNVTGVTTIATMLNGFSNRPNLVCNLSGWNLCNCTNMTNFMTKASIGTGNYSILLNSWEASSTGNPIKPWATGINVNFGTAKYTAASSGARQRLINYGWTITDGGFQA